MTKTSRHSSATEMQQLWSQPPRRHKSDRHAQSDNHLSGNPPPLRAFISRRPRHVPRAIPGRNPSCVQSACGSSAFRFGSCSFLLPWATGN